MLDTRKEEIQQQIQVWLAQEESLEIVSSGEDMRHGYFLAGEFNVQNSEGAMLTLKIMLNV